jgi:hypothetical protein
MKQIIQSDKTGKMEIIEALVPLRGKNCIMVKTSYSLFSAGTGIMLINPENSSKLASE